MSRFPQPFQSTCSHWQATNRGPTSLHSYNPPSKAPDHADIVIIGGGMMGASLSYFLTRKGAEGCGKKIVLVEAKDVASGASGRNGGHVGPATFVAFHRLLQLYPHGAGLDAKEAVQVIQAERDNLELIASVIEKEDLKDTVDFWKGDLCEVHETAEETVAMRKMHEEWQAARKASGLHGNGDIQFVDDPKEAQRISRFNRVSSIQLRPAGSVHSHKLATELMRLAIESEFCDFNLYTWTPVSGLEQKEKGWKVKTSKGDISTPRVILCTNAHTQNFFDEKDPIHAHIRPRFAQCALITPTTAYSGAGALKHTYNMPDEFYLVQTPMGGLVLGGGDDVLIREGKVKLGHRDDVEDDSGVIDAWTDLLARYCPEHFQGWGKEAHGEGLTRVWSGILSNVKDLLPVVGEAPGKPGLFVSAGFHGHGMSRVFSVGQGLASLLQTGQWDTSLLPRSFEYTTERLDRVVAKERELESLGVDVKMTRLESERTCSLDPQPVVFHQPMQAAEISSPARWSCAIM